jgi:hypothetical protein
LEDTTRERYQELIRIYIRPTIEGCSGIGRHLAQRLVADGEPVVDVPAAKKYLSVDQAKTLLVAATERRSGPAMRPGCC